MLWSVMNRTPLTILKLVVTMVESENPPTAMAGLAAVATGTDRTGSRINVIPIAPFELISRIASAEKVTQ